MPTRLYVVHTVRVQHMTAYIPGRNIPRGTTSGCNLSRGVLHILQHNQWHTTEYFATPGLLHCVVNVTHGTA